MKMDDYFREEEFDFVLPQRTPFCEKGHLIEIDFRPAMLATTRKGLWVVKMDNYFSEEESNFRPVTLATVRKELLITKMTPFSEKGHLL